MKNIYVRDLSKNLAVRLQYLFAHASKWSLVYVSIARNEYHVMNNIPTTQYQEASKHILIDLNSSIEQIVCNHLAVQDRGLEIYL